MSPTTELDPYDTALKSFTRAERRDWAANVLNQLNDCHDIRRTDVFELHAGSEYLDFGLIEGLTTLGASVERPTWGMRIGTQLAFYARATA